MDTSSLHKQSNYYEDSQFDNYSANQEGELEVDNDDYAISSNRYTDDIQYIPSVYPYNQQFGNALAMDG